VTIYNTHTLPACCVYSENSISALYSWTQNWWFRASEGLPNKHECLRQDFANYGNEIQAAIVHCPEKNNTLQIRDRKSRHGFIRM